MPKYAAGDTCKYIGESSTLYETRDVHRYICHVLDIKSIHSATMKPMYWVRFEGTDLRCPFGIHEHNLKLLKRRPHSWEV